MSTHRALGEQWLSVSVERCWDSTDDSMTISLVKRKILLAERMVTEVLCWDSNFAFQKRAGTASVHVESLPTSLHYTATQPFP